MDPTIQPIQSIPQPAQSTAWTSHARWRAITGSTGLLALVVVLLLALASCSPAGASTLGVNPAIKGPTPFPTVGSKLPPSPSVQEVAQTTTLSGTSSGPATATCPAGSVALGGGWSVPQANRVYSAQLSGNTWTIYVTNQVLTQQGPLAATGSTMPNRVGQLGIQAGHTVTAYVECLSGVSGAVVTSRAVTASEPPSPNDQLLASPCTASELPVGFGFNLSAPASLEFAGEYPYIIPLAGTLEWFFHVRNYDAVAHPITAYVQCLSIAPASGVNVRVSYPQTGGGQVYSGASASLQAPCPAGAALAGGGFDSYTLASGGNNPHSNLYLMHATASGWQGAVYAVTGSSSFYIDAEAVCLKFS